MFRVKLKELRESKGLSQQKFANMMNISQGTVGNWESGIREPNFETISKIANFFDVSVDYILGRVDEKQNKPGETELEDNLIIYQRNGKTVRKKMSKEQMNLLASMIDAIPEEDNPDL